MVDDVERKLKDLTDSGDFKNGAMKLISSNVEIGLAGILRAIDNTILPRIIDVSVGTSRVSLSVVGRRLRSCASATEDLAQNSQVFGQTLSLEDEEAVKTVGEMLVSLVAKDGSLMLLRNLDPEAAAQSDAGISPGKLAELWDVDLDTAPPSLAEQFQAFLGDDCIASIEIGDEAILGEGGDPATVLLLKTEVLDKFGEIGKNLSEIKLVDSDYRMMVLEGLLPEDLLSVLLYFDQSTAIYAAKPDTLTTIASAFGRI
ncbi:MAG: hypothetical protein AAGK67_12515 [Pseudomonadota bacterium]